MRIREGGVGGGADQVAMLENRRLGHTSLFNGGDVFCWSLQRVSVFLWFMSFV